MSHHKILTDRESAAIDREIRKTIFDDRVAGIEWETTAHKVAGLLASANIGLRVATQRGAFALDRQVGQDLADALEELVFERVISDRYSCQFDPDRCLDGESAIGWAAMFMRSASGHVVRKIVQQRNRTEVSALEDEDVRPHGWPTPRPQEQSDSGDRAAEAEQMISVMGHGLSAAERKGVVVLGIGWYLGLPFPWPQESAIRRWVETNIDGPRSASSAVSAVIKARMDGKAHPLTPMFEGWTGDELAELECAEPMMVFAWMAGAGSARPGPTRAMNRKFTDAMIEMAPGDARWVGQIRNFVKVLREAMSGADRAFGSKDLTVRSDAELRAAATELWTVVEDLAEKGSPLGDDPESVVSRAIALLLHVEYESALLSEWDRVAAS